MFWKCSLLFVKQKGKLWVWHALPSPSRFGGQGAAEGWPKGGRGVAEGWPSSGHLLAGAPCPAKHSLPAWLCAQPLQTQFHYPRAACKTLSSGCHLLSAPLPKIHLQLFYSVMPNPWSEKGLSWLYMELQTCIKPQKMFLSKNLNSCQLP